MNNQYYLIKDFSEPCAGDPKLFIVYGDEIWKILDDAQENDKLIAVYLLGECLLDWS